MGIGESWRAWRRGESFDRVFGYLYLSQEEIDRNLAATSRLDELNRQAFERGRIPEVEYVERTARNHATSIHELLEDPSSSPLAGFKEGLREGTENVQSAIRRGIEAPVLFSLGSIPAIVWIIGLGFLAWRLGLLRRLTK